MRIRIHGRQSNILAGVKCIYRPGPGPNVEGRKHPNWASVPHDVRHAGLELRLLEAVVVVSDGQHSAFRGFRKFAEIDHNVLLSKD